MRYILQIILAATFLSQHAVAQNSLQNFQEQMRQQREESARRQEEFRERMRQASEEQSRAFQETTRRNEEANQRRREETERRNAQIAEGQREYNRTIQDATDSAVKAIYDTQQKMRQNRIDELNRIHAMQDEDRAAENEREARREQMGITPQETQPPPQVNRAATQTPRVFYKVTGVASGDKLNVRSGPGMNYPTVCTAPNGVGNIAITGSRVMTGKTDWYPIRVSKYTGWVRGKYLSAQ